MSCTIAERGDPGVWSKGEAMLAWEVDGLGACRQKQCWATGRIDGKPGRNKRRMGEGQATGQYWA
eukprot:6043036-Prymnesium_polylepis.1